MNESECFSFQFILFCIFLIHLGPASSKKQPFLRCKLYSHVTIGHVLRGNCCKPRLVVCKGFKIDSWSVEFSVVCHLTFVLMVWCSRKLYLCVLRISLTFFLQIFCKTRLQRRVECLAHRKFILFLRGNYGCACLRVAGHLSTTKKWGNPFECLSQRHKRTCRPVIL